MAFFFSLLTFVLFAYHVRVRHFPSPRRVVAYFLALTAVAALWTGFYLAMKEDARSRYGRLVHGVVVEKISTTGAQRTRTIGRHDAVIRTIEGSRSFEVLSRQILSGSPDAWVVDYRYDCDRPRPCWGRDFVPRDLWLALHEGAPVAVRYVPDGIGGARLENNPQSRTALADVGIGAALILLAAALAGLLPALVRRTRRLETTAVVTAVDRVQHLGVQRWRVRFAYLDDLGGSREATDFFATDTWKPGDTGVAVYDVAQPDVAGLRH